MSASTLTLVPTRSRAAGRGRSRLMTGCAVAVALAAAAQAPRATAQLNPEKSFQGTGSVTSGLASIVQSGTKDTITINSQQAVIDWKLDNEGGSGPITFLPEGRIGLFQNGETSNFVVLNRIVPTDQTRAIRFDGTVQSRINVPGAGQVTGGSVWFYSPGGIIAGSTAMFDVGSLVLTANDIDTKGGLFGDKNEIRFRGASGSQSAIQIDPGARIQALMQGSYVALVAPRIVQGGNVRVNGSVGYVAAEAADVTINNGLFDISFVTGTTAKQAIVHNGSTGGPASTGGGDNHAVYMATIAKNDAVSMLLGGSIGHDQASNAIDTGGIVILSAGYDISRASVPVNTNSSPETGAGHSSIVINSSNFLTGLQAYATDSITATPTGDFGTITFRYGTSLTAVNNVDVGVSGAQRINAGGLVLRATGTGDGKQRALLFAAGNETGYGGGINVLGGLTVDASGLGAGSGIIGAGGTATVSVDRNTLSARGVTTISADGFGGFGDTGGDGKGGGAQLLLQNGGSATLGSVSVTANGTGGNSSLGNFPGTGPGGTGTGGAAQVLLTGGSTLNAQGLTVGADGQGGMGDTGGGGDGAGGLAELSLTGGSARLSGLTVSAVATGGRGGEVLTGPGGDATGGTARVTVNGGSLNASFSFDVRANGTSGRGTDSGVARGGIVNLTATGGGSIETGYGLDLDAIGHSGGGVVTAGAATGGTIGISADNGSIRASNLTANAYAYYGLGGFDDATSGQSAVARGGSILLTATNQGSIALSGGGFSGTTLRADATGGVALDPANGGSGTGGIITVRADGGALNLGNFVDISALGEAGMGRGPATGNGGTISLDVSNDIAGNAGSLSFGDMTLNASGVAYGGEGALAAAGSSAVGGRVSINIASGSFQGNNLTARADGFGAGNVNGGFTAGNGTGGTVGFGISGGTVAITNLTLSATGSGGDGGFGFDDAAGNGGDGIGGATSLSITGGSFTNTSTVLDASGTGGVGGNAFKRASGNGGSGTGGQSAVIIGPSANVTIGTLNVGAIGVGGRGGNIQYDFNDNGTPNYDFTDNAGAGGDATGGRATIALTGDSTSGSLTVTSASANASATGGNGGKFGSEIPPIVSGGRPASRALGILAALDAGGNATGGTASITISGTASSFGDASVLADAVAGSGSDGAQPGNGGAATGGSATLTISDATYAASNVLVSAKAQGGIAGGNLTIGLGNGGAATGGIASLLVTGAGTTATVTGSTSVNATAAGGAGAIGGDATGGTANFSITDADYTDRSEAGSPGSSVTSVTAAATGGATIFLAQTPLSGLAGNATGGDATISIKGAGASLVLNSVTIDASGTGGQFFNSGSTGGDGTGGNATYDQANGFVDIGSLSVSAIGRGGRLFNQSGFLGGNGGAGAGGTARATITGGSFRAGSATIEASGYGGDGGFNFQADAGSGGDGAGGTASFIVASGANALVSEQLIVRARGVGGSGGDVGYGSFDYAFGNTTGTGGNGTGGLATVSLAGVAGAADPQIGIGTIIVDSSAIGGDGGTHFFTSGGGDPPLAPDAIGPLAAGGTSNGGSATGGTATLTVSGNGVAIGGVRNLDGVISYYGGASVNANAVAGNGGTGAAGSIGGSGGVATGGNATFNVVDAGLSIRQVDVTANAVAGRGNFSYDGAGGDGGSATGGSATILAQGAATNLVIGNFTLTTDATGGSGGGQSRGSSSTSVGVGGAGQGGTSEIRTELARLSFDNSGFGGSGPATTYKISANGTGGRGGDNDGTFFNPGGAAGNGGAGNGGTARIAANGGTVLGFDFQLDANGYGGEGGFGINAALNGNGGTGTGGTSQILVQDIGTSFGLIQLGAVAMNANGQGGQKAASGTFGLSNGGFISLRDESLNPEGSLVLASLNAQATALNGGGFELFSDTGAIRIAGNATINVGGPASFSAVGSGGLQVGGTLDLASAKTISISHIGQPATGQPFATISAGNILSRSQLGFTAGAGSRIVSTDSITITNLLNDASIADLQAVNAILVETGGNLTIGNALVTAPAFESGNQAVGGTITLRAGRDFFGSFGPNDETPYQAFDLNITGTVKATASVNLLAGGDVIIGGGASVRSDNRISIFSGDDILVQSGGLVRAAENPLESGYGASGDPRDTPALLSLSAGSLYLSSPLAPTNIASIIVDGQLAAPGRAISLSGDAIQVRGSGLLSRDLYADVTAPPAPGTGQLNDNGALDAACVQGNICLTNIQATGVIAIGQGTDRPISVDLGTGNLSAQRIAVSARETIRLGAVGSTSSYSGSTSLKLDSLGNVELVGNTNISGGVLQVIAGGSLLGTGNLSSTGDVGISVGDSINANSIIAGGEITTADKVGGAVEGSYGVSGDFKVGTVGVGGSLFSLTANRSIDIGSTAGGFGVSLIAGNAARLGTANSTGDISIRGASVGFDALDAANITLLGGSVSGNALTAGTISVEGSTIDVASLSGGSASLTAENTHVTTTNLTGSFDVSGGAIDLGTVTTGGGISLNSATGAITFGDISTDASFVAAGLSLTGGTVTAGGDARFFTTDTVIQQVKTTGSEAGYGSIIIDGSTVSAGRLDAFKDILVTASALSGLASPTARGEGGSVLVAGNNINLNLAGNGLIASANAGGNIGFTTTGGLEFGTLDAGGNITGTAGTTIAGDGATAQGGINLISSGDLQLGTARAVQQHVKLASQNGSVTTGALKADAGSVAILAAQNVSTGQVDAAGLFYVGNATQLAALGADYDPLVLRFQEPTRIGGNLTVTGPVTAGNVALGATGQISLADVSSAGYSYVYGGTGLTAGTISGTGFVNLRTISGALQFTRVQSSTFVGIDSGGTINGGTVDARFGFSANAAGNLVLTQASSLFGDGNLSSGSNINVGTVSTARSFNVSAGGNATFGSITTTGNGVGSGFADASIGISTNGSIDIGSAVAKGNIALAAGVGTTGAGPQTIVVDSASAGGDFSADSAGLITLGDIVTRGELESGYGGEGGISSSDISIASRRGIAITSATAAQDLIVNSAGPLTATGALRAGNDINVTARATTLTTANAGNNLVFAIAGPLTGQTLTAGKAINARVQGVVNLTGATAGTTLTIDAFGGNGALTIGTVSAGTNASLSSSGLLTLGTGTAGGTFGVTATGAIDIGSLAAQGIATVTGGNAVTIDAINTPAGGTFTAARDLTVGGLNSGGLLTLNGFNVTVLSDISNANSLAINSQNDLNLQNVTLAGSFGVTVPGMLTAKTVRSGGGISVNATGGIAVDAFNAVGALSLTTDGRLTGAPNPAARGEGGVVLVAGAGMDINSSDALIASANAGGNINILTRTDLQFGTLDAGGAIGVRSFGNIAGDSTKSVGTTTVRGAGTVDITTITTTGNAAGYGGNVSLTSDDGDIIVGTGTLAGSFLATASNGNVNLTSITTTGNEFGYGAGITVNTGGALTGGALDAADTIGVAAASADLTSVKAGSAIGLTLTGGLALGNANAGGTFTVTAGNPITIGTLTSQGLASVTGSGAVTVDAINTPVGGTFTAAGDLTVGGLSSGGLLALNGFNVTVLSDITDANDLAITTQNNLTLQDVTLAGGFGVTVPGTFKFGVLDIGGALTGTAGTAIVGDGATAQNGINLISDGDLQLGTARAIQQNVKLASRNGSVTTGALTADAGSVSVLAAQNVSTGAVSATGIFYVGNASQLATLGSDYDPQARLFAEPVRIGGNLTVAGLITTGTGALNANGQITLGNVASSDYFAVYGGTGLTAGTLSGAAYYLQTLSGPIQFTAIQSSSFVGIASGGAVNGGSVASTFNFDIQAVGDVTLNSATSVRSSGNLTAGANINVGQVSTARTFDATAGGNATFGSITATGAGLNGSFGFASINVDANGSIDIGSAVAKGNIALAAGVGTTGAGTQTIVVDSASAGGDFSADSAGLITLGDIVTRGELESGYGGEGGISSSDISIASRRGVAIASATAAQDLVVNSAGTLTATGALRAGNDINVTARATTLTTANAGNNLAFTINGPLTGQTLTAGKAINASVQGPIKLSGANAGTTLTINAIGGIGAIDIGTASAGTNATLSSSGPLTLGTGSSGGTFGITAAGTIDIGVLTSQGLATVTGGGAVTVDAINTPVGGTFSAARDLAVGGLKSGGLLTLNGFNVAVLSDITDANALAIVTQNDLNLQNVTLAGSFTATVPGTLTAQTIRSGNGISVNAGTIDLAGAFAQRTVDLRATGAISVGTGQAGDDFLVDAGGNVSLGSIVTTGAESGYGGEGSDGFSNINVIAGGNVAVGSLNAFDALSITATGGLAGLPNPAARGEGGSVLIAGAGMDINTNDALIASANAGGNINILTRTGLQFGALDAGGAIGVRSFGGIAGDSTKSVGATTVRGAGTIDITTVTTTGNAAGYGGDVSLTSDDGDIIIGTGAAAGSFTATAANGAATLTSIKTTGNEFGYGAGITVNTGGAVTGGTLDAADAISVTAGSVNLTSVKAGGNIGLTVTGGLILGIANAGGSFTATAGAPIDIGTLTSQGLATVTGSDAVTVDAINTPVGGTFTAAGDLTVGGLSSGGLLTLNGGNVTVLSDITDANALAITTQNNLTLQNVTLAGSFTVAVPGTLTAQTIRSGNAISVNAGTIDLAGAFARRTVDLRATGAISVGTGQAGDDFLVNAGGNVSLGSIVTTGAESGYGGEGGDGFSNIVITSGGNVAVGSLNAFDAMSITATGGLAGLPNPAARGAGGSVLIAGTGIDINTSDALIASAIAGRDINIATRQDLEFGTLDAGRNIGIRSLGGVAGDSSKSIGTTTVRGAGTVDITTITTTGNSAGYGGDVSLTSDNGDIIVGTSTVAGSFSATAGNGKATLTSIKTTGNEFGYGAGITVNSGGALTGGTLDSADAISVTSASVNLTSTKAVGDIELTTTGGLLLGSADAGGTFIATANSGDPINIGTLTAQGFATVRGGGVVTVDAIDTRVGGTFTAAGDLTVGTLNSGGLLTLNGFNVTVLSDITDANRLAINTLNNLTLQNVTLAGSFTVTVPGTLTAQTIRSGDTIFADAGTIDLAGAFARRTVNLKATDAITVGTGQAGDDFLVAAGGNVSLGSIVTTGAETGYGGEGGDGFSNIVITSGGSVAADRLQAADALSLTADGRVSARPNAAARGEGGSVLIAGAGMDINSSDALIASANAGRDINIATRNDLEFGTLEAGRSIGIRAFGGVLGDSTRSVGTTTVRAAGTVDITSITTTGGPNTPISSVSLTSDNGDIIVGTGSVVGNFTAIAARSVSLGSVTTTINEFGYGAGITVDAGGALTGGTLNAADAISVKAGSANLTSVKAGGDIGFTTTGGLILGTADAGGSFTATAGDPIDIGTLTSRGFASVTGGGAVTVDAINTPVGGIFTATGDLIVGGLNSGGLLTLNGFNVTVLSDITDANDLSITTQNDLNLQNVTLTGGFAVTVPGTLTAKTIRSGDSIFVDAGTIDLVGAFARRNVDLRATDAVSVDTGQAGGDFLITAGGNVSLGEIVTTGAEAGYGGEGGQGGSILIRSTGGLVTATKATAFGAIGIEAAGNVSGGDFVAGSNLTVTSDGSFTATTATAGNRTNSGGRNLTINAATGISIQQANAPGDASFTAENGDIVVAQNLNVGGIVSALGKSIQFNALGGLRVRSATATAGGLQITTVGDLQIDAGSATENIALTSNGGTIGLGKLTDGVEIRLRSNDIVIASDGQLGTIGKTRLVDLSNNGRGRTFVGGNGNNGGYDLSATELARIFSGDIFIHAPLAGTQGAESVGSTRAPDVVVGSFTLTSRANNSNGNLAADGTFGIDTPGKLRVVGDATFTGMGNDNRVELTATDAIEVNTTTGSITLNGANGLAGTLALKSDDIFVGTMGALDDVAKALDTDAINDRLALNDGLTSETGKIQAGGLEVDAGNGFYVQNTGIEGNNLADRRGFTVGSGGLTIRTGSANTRIVINGRQVDPTAAGQFITGIDLIERVRILGPDGQPTGTAFDQRSTINGCLIASVATCRITLPFPVQDIIKEVNDPARVTVRPAASPLVELRDFDRVGFQPLIDEPVTGAGNDDLWNQPCVVTPGDPACLPDAGKK